MIDITHFKTTPKEITIEIVANVKARRKEQRLTPGAAKPKVRRESGLLKAL